jgi:hypothetical protein
MKKQTSIGTSLSIALVGLFLAGCSDSSNSDKVNLALAFQLDQATVHSASKIAVAAAETETVHIAWDKIEVVINEIKMRVDHTAGTSSSSAAGSSSSEEMEDESSSSASTDDSGNMQKFDGQWTLDLLDGSSTPALSELALDKGHYRFVQIKSQKGLIDTTNVILAGTATVGDSTDVEVAISLDLTDVVTLHSASVLEITDDITLKATFAAATWFADIDWLVCYDADAKTIIANDKSTGDCADLVKALATNIKKGGVIEKITAE